jgi:peroxiredoxin Q/BCP
MIARYVTAAALGLALASPAAAQARPQQAPAGPGVGEVAPGFSATVATKQGTLPAPVTLADLKGKTVVLAFFPRARSGGCTAQMTAYRDQYGTLFNGGKDVVLLGISTDADTTLASWAREQDFPFQFIADADGSVGRLYGAMTETSTSARRYLYVIAPDGKITYTAKQFMPFAPQSYTDLGDAVKKASAAATHGH